MWSCEKFVEKHLELVDLEEQAEIEENRALYQNCTLKDLRSSGYCLLKLEVRSCKSGMYGRNLVTFKNLNWDTSLPSHNLKSGDFIGLVQSKNIEKWDSKMCGVLTEVKAGSITVALDKLSKLEESEAYHMFRMANFSTYKRMRKALRDLGAGRNLRQMNMISVLFGCNQPSCIDSSAFRFSFVNEDLNEEQKEAVRFALCQKEVAVIHGPPGTGKTTTLIEIILQLIKQGCKVLACAPSNVATDNLLENVAVHTKKVVRLGHPARTLPGCQHFNIDSLISNSDSSKIIRDVESSISLITDCIQGNDFTKHRRSLREERRKLVSEVRERQSNLISDVLKNCDVVVSTLVSATNDGPLNHLPRDYFDIAVIDECSQAVEAACWIPLLAVKRCVLAGDHLQLPPIIMSEEAVKRGYGETLMERVLRVHGNSIKKLLTTQYRMHQDIMDWPSKELYDNALIAHKSVAKRLLRDISGVEDNENTTIPLLLIDTAGCDMWDFEMKEDDSKGNEGEADLVTIHVEALIKSGLIAEDIAVITPYSLQVDLLKSRLSEKYPNLEIRSVDGFQGREKEAVVLSLVRSNIRGQVGFLRESRRINVAITRAKRHMAVICDSETVSQHPFMAAFVEYMQEKGEVRSAFQYESKISSLPENKWIRDQQTALSSEFPKKVLKKHTETPEAKNSTQPKYSDKRKEQDTATFCTAEGPQTLKCYREKQSEKFREIIEKFLQEPDPVLMFSPELGAYERMLVHEIAEELKLIHHSEGLGSERYIVVTKREIVGKSNHRQADPPFKNLQVTDPQKPDTPCRNFRNLQDIISAEAAVEDDLKQNFQDTLSCEETENIEVDSLDGATARIASNSHSRTLENAITSTHKGAAVGIRQQETKNTCQQSKCRKEEARSSKKSKNQLKPVLLENADLTEFDALLEAAVKMDSMCMFSKCKNNVKILLQTCLFCKHRYCLSHSLPEIHGCGEAAKSHARSMIRKEGKIYPGSGKPEKKQNPAQHAQLQRKLDKKLADLSSKRKHNASKPKS